MLRRLIDLARGVALLRFPETATLLGEMRFRYLAWQRVAAEFPNAKIDNGVEFVSYEPGRLWAGNRVSIRRGTVLAFGDAVNGFGRIVVGEGTWIGEYNNLRACEGGDILVGCGCLISQFCTLVGSNHSIARGHAIATQGPDRSRLGVELGDDVWLGAGVSVMPGVRIGIGVVVAANAVVTRSVPDYEIWAGTPARRIGERR